VLASLRNGASKYRGYFDYILVDEAQDLSRTEADIIDEMAKGNDYRSKNVWIVYDNNQNILNDKNTIDISWAGKQLGRVV
jgi:superfamily I DNA/RNA helicase